MRAADDAPRGASWADLIRRAPVGVLVMGGLLSFLAAGFVLGGSYLGLSRADAGWVPWVAVLFAGPVLLYFGLHLLKLTPWAWLATVLLLVLLFASSIARAVLAPETGFSPFGEMVVEAGWLLYLWRPSVRQAFGRR